MDNIGICETPVSRSSGNSKKCYSRFDEDRKKALDAVRRVIDFGNPAKWSYAAQRRGFINVTNTSYTKEESPACPALPRYFMGSETPTRNLRFVCGRFGDSPAKQLYKDENITVERKITGFEKASPQVADALKKNKNAMLITQVGNPNIIENVDRSGIKKQLVGDEGEIPLKGKWRESRSTIRNRVPRGQTRKLASLFESLAEANKDYEKTRLPPAPRTKSVPAPRFQYRDLNSESFPRASGDGLTHVPKPLNRCNRLERNSELQQVEVMRSEEGVKSLAKKLEDSGFLCSPSAASLRGLGSPAQEIIQRNLLPKQPISRMSSTTEVKKPEVNVVAEKHESVSKLCVLEERKSLECQASTFEVGRTGSSSSSDGTNGTECDGHLYEWGDEHVELAGSTDTHYHEPSYDAKNTASEQDCVELCDANYMVSVEGSVDQRSPSQCSCEEKCIELPVRRSEASKRSLGSSIDELDQIGVVDKAFKFVNEVDVPTRSVSSQQVTQQSRCASSVLSSEERLRCVSNQHIDQHPPDGMLSMQNDQPLVYDETNRNFLENVQKSPVYAKVATNTPRKNYQEEAHYVNLEKKRDRGIATEPLASSTPVTGSPYLGDRIKENTSTLNRSFVSSILNNTCQNNASNEADLAAEIKRLQDGIFHWGNEAFKATTIISRRKKGSKANSEFELCAQRDLLLARERQVMLQREMQRIKDLHLARKPWSTNPSKKRGHLNIYSITVYLNRNFCLRNLDEHDSYAFLVLMKTNEAVEATELLTLMDTRTLRVSSVHFNDQIRFENLPTNFSLKLEVYALKIREMQCADDRSCALLKSKAKLLLSPLRKASSNVSIIGTTGFTRYGHTYLTKDLAGVRKIYLDAAEYPLEGTIEVQSILNSAPLVVSIDFSGFLTMYEIIARLGSWTRYWAVLRQGVISFWRDPNDETSDKPPVSNLDLSCCTKNVITQCSVEECCRRNTFGVDIVVQSNSTCTTKRRILLSADCKEMCEGWMEALNKTLQAVRN